MTHNATIPTNFIMMTLRRKFYSFYDGRPLKEVLEDEEYQRIKKAYIEVLFLRLMGGK